VIGAPFLVMEYVAGPVARTELPAAYGVAERAVLAGTLVDTLAAIHSVEVAAVGLAGFGRPDGFLARQVARWSRQWAATPGEALPELDALGAALAEGVPDNPAGQLVHGDYRLDNTILTAHTPGIAAVLDWELSTLGDPLADLGLLLVYWAQPDDDDLRRAAARGSTLTRMPGFPSRREVTSRYARVSGRDVASLPWYVAFGCFKLAVVLAGVAARHRAGAMVGDGFAGIASAPRPLAHLGLQTLSSDNVD
jgi:aminoglycoside phosphotransferase (APT) family kinase protein